jgi:hypothetical protein
MSAAPLAIGPQRAIERNMAIQGLRDDAPLPTMRQDGGLSPCHRRHRHAHFCRCHLAACAALSAFARTRLRKEVRATRQHTRTSITRRSRTTAREVIQGERRALPKLTPRRQHNCEDNHAHFVELYAILALSTKSNYDPESNCQQNCPTHGGVVTDNVLRLAGRDPVSSMLPASQTAQRPTTGDSQHPKAECPPRNHACDVLDRWLMLPPGARWAATSAGGPWSNELAQPSPTGLPLPCRRRCARDVTAKAVRRT